MKTPLAGVFVRFGYSRDVMSGRLRSPVVLAIIVGFISASVFVAALPGDWLYDDNPLIAQNQYVHAFEHWPRWFVEDFWNLNEEFVRFDPRIIYWRPAISATYALDWTVSGGSAVWFHFTNLCWHALVGGLSFIVLRRWLVGATWPAFTAALLFAVHPTKAESVAWISGRTDVICMVAVLLVSEGIARRLAGKRGGLALEIGATVIAYMSKEQAIVLPAFAAVEYWVARGRPVLDVRAVGQMLRGAVPQLVVAIGYLAARGAFMPIESAGAKSDLPLFEHALIVAESLGRYLQLTFVPVDLSVQQGLIRIENGELVRSLPHVVLGIGGVLVLVAGALLARRKYPIVTVGIAFYLATLSPTSNIVFSQMLTLVSERFLYLPMFGFALVVGWALAQWRVRWLWGVVLACLLATSVQTIRRSADYGDTQTFWARELELHEDSRQARMMLIAQLITKKSYAEAMLQILKLADTRTSERVEIAFLLARIVAGLVPDRDRGSLEAIDRFLQELVAAKPGTATLAVRDLRYTVPIGTPLYAKELERFRLRMIALRTDVTSRLGDDATAVTLANQVLTECPRCTGVASMAALAIARAAKYEDSLAALERVGDPEGVAQIRKMVEDAVAARNRAFAARGPAQLQAHASELAALELWGRAYEVLAPHKEQIKHAPKMVLGFAELAVRAGDTASAREVLAGTMSPAEIDQNVAVWSMKMGW